MNKLSKSLLLIMVTVCICSAKNVPVGAAAKVTAVKVESPAGSAKTVYVARGKKVKLLTLVKAKSKKDRKVTYIVKNKNIAKVTKKGIIKGCKVGKTTIIVRSKVNKKKKAAIKLVVKKGAVKSITLNKEKVSIEQDMSISLKTNIVAEKKSYKAVAWKTSNKDVAVVTSNGTVKAVKPGTVTITVKSLDGSNKSAKCVVTVNKKESNKPTDNNKPVDTSETNQSANKIMSGMTEDPVIYVVGQAVNDIKTISVKGDIVNAKVEGNLPEGMAILKEKGKITFAGTPKQAGVTEIKLYIEDTNTVYMITYKFIVIEKDGAYAEAKNIYVANGESISVNLLKYIQVYGNAEQCEITEVVDLPDGLSFNRDTQQIDGTVQKGSAKGITIKLKIDNKQEVELKTNIIIGMVIDVDVYNKSGNKLEDNSVQILFLNKSAWNKDKTILIEGSTRNGARRTVLCGEYIIAYAKDNNLVVYGNVIITENTSKITLNVELK